MQLGSHHVRPKDFYFRVNWERLVKQEVFLKQADLGETYLDTLFNSATLTRFWPRASIQLGTQHKDNTTFWNGLLATLTELGYWQTTSASSKSQKTASSTSTDSSSIPPACHGSWTNCPDLRKTGTEEAFAHFLNTIALAVEKCTHSPISRSWTAKYSTSCVFGHNARRKPDLVLLDGRPTPKDKLISGNWRIARAVAELKSSSKNTSWKEIREQLAGEYLRSVGLCRN